MAGDIKNAYLQVPTKVPTSENHCIVCGPEFSPSLPKSRGLFMVAELVEEISGSILGSAWTLWVSSRRKLILMCGFAL